MRRGGKKQRERKQSDCKDYKLVLDMKGSRDDAGWMNGVFFILTFVAVAPEIQHPASIFGNGAIF